MAPSGQDMFESLRQTWEAIPRETTDKLVASFFDRCRMVLSLNGESAGPWLSSGRCPPVMNPELRNWTEEEDRQLIDLVESQGRHWKVLANATGVDPLLLKHRYRLLVEALRNLRISNDSSPPDIRFFLAPDLHASLSAMTLDEFLDMLPARLHSISRPENTDVLVRIEMFICGFTYEDKQELFKYIFDHRPLLKNPLKLPT